MFDVLWSGHLGWFGVAGGGILPEVFEPAGQSVTGKCGWEDTYSSVAFISGHDCGEQNSVIEP